MSEAETGTPSESEARASARRHTAQLLKMLRGYGPATEPPPAVESRSTLTAEGEPKSAAVAEIAPVYARLLEIVPVRSQPPAARAAENPSLPADPAGKPSPSPPAQERGGPGIMLSAGDYLNRRQGALGRLIAQAERLSRCNRIFRAYLPPHLQDHVVLVSLDQENWTVHTDSATWATRLRYALHNVRQALGNQLGIPLPKPRVLVVPASLPPYQPPRPRFKLSEQNARLLEVTARAIPDARLSAALRRLAAHGRGRCEEREANSE